VAGYFDVGGGGNVDELSGSIAVLNYFVIYISSYHFRKTLHN
jgi:hypothetical protein